MVLPSPGAVAGLGATMMAGDAGDDGSAASSCSKRRPLRSGCMRPHAAAAPPAMRRGRGGGCHAVTAAVCRQVLAARERRGRQLPACGSGWRPSAAHRPHRVTRIGWRRPRRADGAAGATLALHACRCTRPAAGWFASTDGTLERDAQPRRRCAAGCWRGSARRTAQLAARGVRSAALRHRFAQRCREQHGLTGDRTPPASASHGRGAGWQ